LILTFANPQLPRSCQVEQCVLDEFVVLDALLKTLFVEIVTTST